jgi:hypothetical protein
MDINDLEKEIMEIRKKNHKISNILMGQEAQLESFESMKSDISDIKNSISQISDSLSGGLVGSGLINRVEILENKHNKISYWMGVIGATVLAMFLKQGYNLVFAQPIIKPDKAIVRADTSLYVESEEKKKEKH